MRSYKMPEYRVYRQMLDRCYLTTAQNHRYYGAKGIKVCQRWKIGDGSRTGFECFISDMGPRPDGLTLDRIDPEKNYEPSNCRWATWQTQRTNMRIHKSPEAYQRFSEKLSAMNRGELSPLAKLTDAKVATIKRLLKEGGRTSVLAKQFDVAPQTICNIKHERRWPHIRAEAA
jgi:hypothetical protein